MKMKTFKMKQGSGLILTVGVALLSGQAFGEDAVGASEPFKLGNYELSAVPELQFQVVNGEKKSAKFNEYRDLTTGVAASANIHMNRDAYYTDLTIKDAGRKDQEYMLSGGKYETFNYKLRVTEMPHNLSFGAQTFFQGVGTNNLYYYDHPYYGPVTTPTNSTTAKNTTGPAGAVGWKNNFDYSLDIFDYAAEGSLSLFAPFYGDFGVEKRTTKGIKPFAVGTIELPMPVDFVNNTAFLEVGYRKENLKLSAKYDFSQFKSASDYLYYKDLANVGGSGGTTDLTQPDKQSIVTIAPSSYMNKATLSGVIGDLPFNSTLNMQTSYAVLTDKVELVAQMPTKTLGSEIISDPTFKGDVRYHKVDISVTSRPIEKLNTRLYGSYLNNTNNSTRITTLGITSSGTHETNAVFSYKKAGAGFDGNYRLPFDSKVAAGYHYTKSFRPDRTDALQTNQNDVFVKLSNNTFDWLDASLKGELLYRRSQFKSFGNVSETDPRTQVYKYVRPFDLASKNMWKLTAETNFIPIEGLGVDLSYGASKSNYIETQVGRVFDQIQEAYLASNYQFKGGYNVSGFVDMEDTSFKNNSRYVSAGSSGNPSEGDKVSGNAQAFNWGENDKTRSWGYGLTADAPITSKVSLGVSWLQDITKGSRAFSVDPIVQTAIKLQDIGEVDNAKHSLLNVKATYAATSRLTASIGFVFDQLKYEDDAYKNYELKPQSTSSANANGVVQYLTGAYRDSAYSAQVYYIAATYRL